MDIFDLFFGAGTSVHTIMKLGFMPNDDDYLELTDEQYQKYYKEVGYTEEKVYAILPKNPQNHVPAELHEIVVCTESEIALMKQGWQIIESYCSSPELANATDQQKLAHAASKLPDVFSKGTPFEETQRREA